MKRIRQGNTINFRYSVYRSSGNLEEEEDLTGIEVTTSLQNRLYGTLVDIPFSIEGNVITGQIPGIPHLRTGVYNFCLSYQKDGTDFTVDTDAFQIVDSSSKTGGENTCPHVEAETVELKGVVEFGVIGSGGIEQVQADWKESNEQSKAFIQNKPDLKMVATSGSYNDLSDKPNIPTQLDVPTKTSQLTNDSGFISDPNYVHTDNNYSNEEKEKVAGLQNYDDAALRAALQNEINRATLAEGGLDAAVKKVAFDLSGFITGSPDADDIINRWQEVTAFLNGITEDKTLSGMLLDLKKQIDESVTAKLSDYYTSVRVDELFVKKLVGSRLITEEEALKLAGLQNYDDTTVKASLQEEINRATEAESNLDAAVKKVASDFAAFLSGDPDADDLINRWQEVTAFLQGITEEKTLSGMLLGVKQEINESVTAKLADYYTSSRIDELFVKKLVGSRLITEEEATKLADLQDYDDTSLTTRVTQVENNSPVSLDVTEWMSQLDPDSTSSVKITGTQEHLDLFEKGVKNGIMAYSTSDEGKAAVVYQVNLDKTTLANAVSYVLFLYYINPDSIKRYRISLQRTDGLPGGPTIGGYISQSTILDLSKKANQVPVTEETSSENILLYGNEYYKLGNRSTLSISLAYTSELELDFYYEYMFEFTASVDNMPLSISHTDGSTIKWITEPEITSGKTYQVSIVNNLAVIGGA